MNRQMLIKAGVKNLKDFGYPGVTEENIFTDQVYGLFFKSMLQESLSDSRVDSETIDGLIAEIDSKRSKNRA